jgi:hypothetical protein
MVAGFCGPGTIGAICGIARARGGGGVCSDSISSAKGGGKEAGEAGKDTTAACLASCRNASVATLAASAMEPADASKEAASDLEEALRSRPVEMIEPKVS